MFAVAGWRELLVVILASRSKEVRCSASTSAAGPPSLDGTRKAVQGVIQVKVRQNESLDEALRRFRRKVRKSGLMQQLRRRSTYEKPSERRRRKERLARKRTVQELLQTGDSYPAVRYSG